MKNEQGFSLIKLLFICFLICVSALIIMKVGSVYFDTITIQKIVDNIEIKDKSKDEIRTEILQQLSLSNIKYIEKDNINIENSDISVSYSIQENIVGNFTYDKDFEIIREK